MLELILNSLIMYNFDNWVQFHHHFTRAFFVRKFDQSQTQSREKLARCSIFYCYHSRVFLMDDYINRHRDK